MKKALSCLVLAFTLVRCAGITVSTPDEAGPYPADYRRIVSAAIKSDFYDPMTLQTVSVTTPFPARWQFQPGWAVCLRANGKNLNGAYAGEHEFGYLIRNGSIILEGDYINCQTAQYTEWPEMEMMGGKRQ